VKAGHHATHRLTLEAAFPDEMEQLLSSHQLDPTGRTVEEPCHAMQGCEVVNADNHKATRHPSQLTENGQSFRVAVPKVEQANTDHPIERVIGKGQLENTGTHPPFFGIPELAPNRQTNHLEIQINPKSLDPQMGKQGRKPAIATGNVKQGAPLQPALRQQFSNKVLLTPVNPDLIQAPCRFRPHP
jgi:hypothetical protein